MRAATMSRRHVFWTLTALATAFAAWHAWSLRWTCDDAYVSFRYAQHLVDGHGLVFNRDPAEAPVEGYSNFLWTLLCALGQALGFGGDAIEGWAAAWGTLFHAATATLLARAAWDASGRTAAVPIAAVAWAAHHHAASLAPAGLETAMFGFLLAWAAVQALRLRSRGGALLLGTAAALAALVRPDGALACAAALALAFAAARRTGDFTLVVRTALPMLAVAAHLLWRLAYYGDLVPNTFHAKSGGDPYPGQGVRYAAWYFAVYWPLAAAAVVLVVGLLRRGARAPWLVLGAFVAPYVAFVVWVGGDFMFARFLLPVTPLLLLGLDLGANDLAPARLRGAALQAGVAAAVVAGFAFRQEPRWLGDYANPNGFSDNRAISVAPIDPVKLPGKTRLDAYRFAGNYLGWLFDGLDVRIGLGGSHANLAYRSRVPVAVECAAGLTDRFIARVPVPARGTVGHERNYTLYRDYLVSVRKLHVMFELTFHTADAADPFRDVHFQAIPGRLVIWDRAMLAEWKKRDPNVRFADFEKALDDYIASLPEKPREQVAADYAAFRRFYFDHNVDPERRRAFEQFLQAR